MGFSPVYQHYADILDDNNSLSPIFQHRFLNDFQPFTMSSIFQHRFVSGSGSSFAAIFQHLAEVAAQGRIRGDQLESPLQITRAIDFDDSGSETNTSAGVVRLFAQNKVLRFVNEDGLNVNLSLLGVPLGGIISWWPAPEFNSFGNRIEAELPEGFEYCDGTAVQTANSPLLGFFKPALMRTDTAPTGVQRFIKGADITTASFYGAGTTLITGGSETHTHTGSTFDDGAHTHDAGDHRHVVLTQNSSSENTSGAVITGAAGGGFLISDADGPGVTDTEVLHRHTVTVPAHDHGGFTGPDPLVNNTDSVGETASGGLHNHDFQITDTNHEPPYVELAFIIRVI